MRIAHVSATFPPYYGGTGNVCYHNARVLAARGHDVHVFTADWPGEPDDPPGVTVHRLKPWLRVGNAPVLPQLLRIGQFDVVHLHYPFYTGAEFIALTRTPYVVTYHQDVELDGLLGVGTRLHGRTLGETLLRRAARVCPTSLDYFRHCNFANLLEYSPRSISVVPNGVDIQKFQPGPIDLRLRRQYGVPAEVFCILFVGAMDRAHYFKGIPTLLQALQQFPDVHAILVGEGDLRAKYERDVEESGLASRVKFAGRVSADQLPALYRSANVTVLPSETRGEAFGMVLLEAMATGRPVIASDLAGVRSVVTDGEDGYLTPPGDVQALATSLQRILRMSPAMREAMGQAGRDKTETEYCWQRVGTRLEQLYDDVLDERAMQRAS